MKYKLFISANQKELRDERFAVKEVINSNATLRDFFNVFLFEDLPAKGKSPTAMYLKNVANSDVYVCIIGRNYGDKGKDGLSATEREFRHFLKTKSGGEIIAFIKGLSPEDARRDFETQSFVKDIKTSIFDDRVEVSNPGGLLPGLNIKRLEGHHATRNEAICRIFHETMDMERFGTGIGKMKKLMKEHGLSVPVFEEEGNFFVVRFYGPGDKILDLVSSIPEERQTDLKKSGLNERQIEALRLMVNEKKKITNTIYRKIFNTSERSALRDLNNLLEKGFVKRTGHRRAAEYEAI
jgi:hypothetical protein